MKRLTPHEAHAALRAEDLHDSIEDCLLLCIAGCSASAERQQE
jgi:hypothetical protein